MAFVVPARFCGPPASGNGGWVSGHLSRIVGAPSDGAVTVRLRTPPPLNRELEVRHDGDLVLVVDSDTVVAQASAVAGLSEPALQPVPLAQAEAAEKRYEGLAGHPFPTCFSCGTAREPGDGLRLQPGALHPQHPHPEPPDPGELHAKPPQPGALPSSADARQSAYACVWTPAEDADLETVWAALDCPGGWASGIAGRPMVLGIMTAQVRLTPQIGVPHVVMAWQRGEAGRKHFSGTAVFTPEGRLVAQAEATWVAVDPSTIRPAGGPS